MSKNPLKSLVLQEYDKITEEFNDEVRKAYSDNNNFVSQYMGNLREQLEFIPTTKVINSKLEKIPSLPQMLPWIPVSRNIKPRWAPEAPVNAKICTGGPEDDEIFVRLVNSLSKHEMPSSNLRNEKASSEIVFRAISGAFSTLGSAEELQERYRELVEEEPLSDSSDLVSNIDSVEAENVSRRVILRTHHLLYCRRCHLYDCPSHDPDDRPDPNLPKRHFPEQKSLIKPCGPKCYQVLSGDPTETIPASSFLDEFHETDEECTWTGSDQTLFRALQRVFLDDYCAISVTLMNKTCQQVYLFAQTQPASSETLTEPKKALSQDPNHNWRVQITKDLTEEVYGYVPCTHAGPCDDDCSCIRDGTVCEKFCNCDKGCKNRFPGCSCTRSCRNNHCSCYLAARECDPDLCRICGAGSYDLAQAKCDNIKIQRGIHKEIFVAPSKIEGWGAFIKHGAEKNELITEYYGEIISQEDAEDRGIVYDERKCSYLFNLNAETVIDATHFGNSIKFANHSKRPNCQALNRNVCGDNRIGIFAKRQISAGEELCFDYGYTAEDEEKFVSGRKRTGTEITVKKETNEPETSRKRGRPRTL